MLHQSHPFCSVRMAASCTAGESVLALGDPSRERGIVDTLIPSDTDGYVAMWRLRTFRPRYLWKAHEGGILGLAELDGGLLTYVVLLAVPWRLRMLTTLTLYRQGRDNFVHLYHFPLSGKGAEAKAGSSIDIGAATAVPSPSHPSPGFGEPGWTLDVNAMNFCRMSVLPLRPTKCVVVDRKGKGRADPDCDLEEAEQDTHTGGGALIAVPSLTKDDCVRSCADSRIRCCTDP